jgi:hypothetical protein
VRAEAKRIEGLARRKEFLLGDMNHGTAAALDAADDVNDLIINSIRAKLALIDNN